MTDDELPGLRTHDLPVAWDGLPVTWGPWRPEPWTTARFHFADMGACQHCGSLTPGRTAMAYTTTTAPDSTHLQLRLHLTRCGDCRHDVVVDLTDQQVYDLDVTDYGPTGSHPPPQTPKPPANRPQPPRKAPQPDQPTTDPATQLRRLRGLIRPTRAPDTRHQLPLE